jgi:hypothetical protein
MTNSNSLETHGTVMYRQLIGRPRWILPAWLARIAGLSLRKFLLEPRQQLFDNTAEFSGGYTHQSAFHGIPGLQTEKPSMQKV